MGSKTEITTSKGRIGFPSSRKGWMEWYIKRYCNKVRTKAPAREIEICATQAHWFQLNILAFGDKSYSPKPKKTK